MDDETGRFRIIGWAGPDRRFICQLAEIPFNQTYTKRLLKKTKQAYLKAGLTVDVEEVHMPEGGWGYH